MYVIYNINEKKEFIQIINNFTYFYVTLFFSIICKRYFSKLSNLIKLKILILFCFFFFKKQTH